MARSRRLKELRVFYISADESRIPRFETAFTSGRWIGGASTDPRGIKNFATGGCDAVVIDPDVARPPAAQLARALRAPLGDRVAILCSEATNDDAFDGTLTLLGPPALIRDRMKRAILEVRRKEADPRVLNAELEVHTRGLANQTHYEVLGVEPKAPLDTIRKAYDALTLKFHPDRLRAFDDRDALAKASALTARIGEAYRVLKDATARAAYDRSLGFEDRRYSNPRHSMRVSTLAQLSTDSKVQRYLKLADSALKQGDRAMALAQLRFAQTQEPGNQLIATKIKELDPSAES